MRIPIIVLNKFYYDKKIYIVQQLSINSDHLVVLSSIKIFHIFFRKNVLQYFIIYLKSHYFCLN